MERSKRLKKILKIIIISALVIFVIMTALSFIKIPFSKHWKSQDIFGSKITKIELARYPESFDGWVEFSDEDLIQKWVDYFNSIDLQHSIGLDASSACAACFPSDGMGGDEITVYAENSTIRLNFINSKKMYFGGGLRWYNVTGGEYPFDEVYGIAEERHGLVKN